MACGNGIVSRYGSDQTSQLTTASLQASIYISSNAMPSQVRCHDSKLTSSHRASKCSKTSTTKTLLGPHRAVQPLRPSFPLVLRRIWKFTASTLHRHLFRQIACRGRQWPMLHLAPSRLSTRHHLWYCIRGALTRLWCHLQPARPARNT